MSNVFQALRLRSIYLTLSSPQGSKVACGFGSGVGVLAGVLVISGVLSGCQTVATDEFATSSNYRTTTQPTDTRNRNPQEIAKIRTALAAQYIRDNELDAANRQLEQAFAADSRYAPAYDMMGVLLQQEGSSINLEKADSYFRRAIALDKDFMQAYNNYGVYLSQMQRYDDAIKQFEIAGSALGYDGRISALENMGRTYLQMGDETQASRAFMRALDGNRNSLIAHIELTDLLIKNNRIRQAQQLYDNTLFLIAPQPLSPRLYLQGIKLAAATNDINTRQQLAQELLANYPLSDEAKQLRVWLNNPEATWK